MCDDLDPCTVDTCDPSDGKCRYQFDEVQSEDCQFHPKRFTVKNLPDTCASLDCDDDNMCTKDCSGWYVTCDDNNDCTKDTCDIKSGCHHVYMVSDHCSRTLSLNDHMRGERVVSGGMVLLVVLICVTVGVAIGVLVSCKWYE